MILGALIDLGVKSEDLFAKLKKLNVSNFDLTAEKVDRSGIAATKAKITLPEEHAHRHLHTIEKIINDSDLNETVKARAIKIFTIIAEAEAKVHGTSVEKIHFHEVGAMDAIIDIVGACVGFELLDIENFACSKIHTGSGFVKMAHGKFPVPPPAVAEILQSKNAPVYQTEIEGELITPTGAAIIAAVCESFGAMPEMKIQKTAYGAGGREYKDFPNVLRLILGEVQSAKCKVQSPSDDVQSQTDHRLLTPDHLLLIETNIDDLSPQILGFVMERAFELGALDCWFTPIQMKKNRPATMISILCEQEKRAGFLELLYTETSTLGARIREVERDCLPRETVTVETEFGAVDVKIAKFQGKIVNAKPEYEQIREIALQSKKSLREIEKEIAGKIKNIG